MHKLLPKTDKMHHISEEDFRLIIWLPNNKRVDQFINTITFTFVNNLFFYLKGIFESTPHFRKDKFAKIKIYFWKTNMELKAISFVGPPLWNSLSELIKKAENLILLSIMLKTIA